MPKGNGFGLKSYARRPGARAAPRKVPHPFDKYLPQLCGLSDSSNQTLDLRGCAHANFPAPRKPSSRGSQSTAATGMAIVPQIRAGELRGLWLKYNGYPIDYI
jgi:hypothetical protein